MITRTCIVLLMVILAGACGDGKGSIAARDTVVVRDTVVATQGDWQEGFGLSHDPEKDSIWGKPVSFYINDPKCDPVAKDFYYGMFRPGDDHSTQHLLGLVTKDDAALRPFYRWILTKTIQVQDGALAEHTGVPARLYAEKFPKEFFEYMDHDSAGQRYRAWVDAIGYSGFFEGESADKQEARQRMARKMKLGYASCPVSVGLRIESFASDCFR